MPEGSRSRRYRMLSVLWALVCALLLLAPGDELPGSDWPAGVKTALEISVHLGLFLALAWLAIRGFANSPRGRPVRSAASARRKKGVFAIVLAYCVLLEVLQMPLTGRTFELLDLAVGALGVTLGAWARS